MGHAHKQKFVCENLESAEVSITVLLGETALFDKWQRDDRLNFLGEIIPPLTPHNQISKSQLMKEFGVFRG